MREINQIILHCSATKPSQQVTVEDIKKWHVEENGWSACGYHYVIELNGDVSEGRNVEIAGAHCKGHNASSIGVCYIGGLDEDGKPKNTLNEDQKESLFQLVKDLLDEYGLKIEQVRCHNEYNSNKACPSFKRKWFLEEYDKWAEKRYEKYLKDKNKGCSVGNWFKGPKEI